MGNITLVTGGARSGKSDFALAHAESLGKNRAFIATAQALDDEMHARIERHKKERGDSWQSVEEPLRAARWIRDNSGEFDVVLLDCMTLWLSNTMFATEAKETKETNSHIASASDELINAMRECKSKVVVVTNEVGMGIVPESALGREFRDHAGRLNRLVAEAAVEVYLVVSGIPLCIKPGQVG